MSFAAIGPTEIFISALAPAKFDRHVQDWRWHQQMILINPNYLADIAARQADKRKHGIGPEGTCHA